MNNVKKKKKTERRRKVVAIDHFLVKYLKTDHLSCRENFVKVSTQQGAMIEDILIYIEPVVRKIPDTFIIDIGTNDLTNDVVRR